MLNENGLSIYYEEKLYDTDTDSYILLFSPLLTIISVTGEVDGTTTIFEEGTDYISNALENTIDWLTSGTKPDHLSKFYVSYTFFPSIENLMTRVFDRIKSAKPSLNTNIGSSTYTLVASLLSPLEDLWIYLLYFQEQAYVDTAEGGYLDAVASILGAEREQPTTAYGIVTFSRVLPAIGNIEIPMGTKLATIVTTSGAAKYYQTTETVTLLIGNVSVDADIEAMTEGVIGNTGSNTVTVMVDIIGGIDAVTNDEPISGGYNIEDDDTFRYRVRDQLDLLGKGTHTAIKALCETVEGIKEAIVEDRNNNAEVPPGECDIMLIGENLISETSPEFLEVVALIMNDDNLPAGIYMTFSVPDLVYLNLDITATLELKVGSSAADAHADALHNLTAYINGGTDIRGINYEPFTINQDLNRNQIIAKVLDVPEITDIESFIINLEMGREPHTFTTQNEEELLVKSDSEANCDITLVIGTDGGVPEHTFVENTDWEVKKVTVSGDTTLYVKWKDGGNFPDTSTEYYVTYWVREEDDPIAVEEKQILRVGDVAFTDV